MSFKTVFTAEEVKQLASTYYGKAICCDLMEDALKEPTLNDAVSLILLDTVTWDSPTGNCLDKEIWKRISNNMEEVHNLNH